MANGNRVLHMPLKDEVWRLDLAAYPVRNPLQTRYGDVDSNGHLNNVAIARLLEEARGRFHRILFGASETSPAGQARELLVAHVTIDYLAEGEYGPDVESSVAVTRIGTSSYRLAIGLFQLGRAIALADAVMVVRDAGTTGAPRIADDLRARLKEFTRTG